MLPAASRRRSQFLPRYRRSVPQRDDSPGIRIAWPCSARKSIIVSGASGPARMLVNMPLKLRALRRMDLRIAAAAVIALLGVASAHAGGVMTSDCLYDHSGGYGHGAGAWSCVRTWHDGQANPYVIRVPNPQPDQETAQAAERERLWQGGGHPGLPRAP